METLMDVPLNIKVPPALPKKLPVNVNFNRFSKEFSEAYRELLNLKSHSNIKDAFYLVAPIIVKEAQQSSEIEGIHTTLQDTFLHGVGEKTTTMAKKVDNYKKAMLFAIGELPKKPLSINLIKDIHKVLLANTDDDDRPGDFRDNNHIVIGTKTKGKLRVRYQPPDHKKIDEYMHNLEDFIHNKNVDPLIRAAVMHYQLEAIHPFRDGNGRLGRILIPLFLYQENILDSPAFYISGQFNKEDVKYRDTLHKVDLSQEYDEWIKFFLKSLSSQAKINLQIIRKINALYHKTVKIFEDSRSIYLENVLMQIFYNPYFRPSDIYKALPKAHKSTITKIIKNLLEKKLIIKVPGLKTRRTIYYFPQLLDLLYEEYDKLA